MHLWRYVTYVFLYVPDALTVSTLLVEEYYVTSVALWVISADEAEKSGFASAILSRQCPFLAVAHCRVWYVRHSV